MGKNNDNNCFLFLHVCNNSKKLGTVGGIGGSVFLFFYFLSLGFKYHKYSPIHAKCVVSDAPAYWDS